MFHVNLLKTWSHLEENAQYGAKLDWVMERPHKGGRRGRGTSFRMAITGDQVGTSGVPWGIWLAIFYLPESFGNVSLLQQASPHILLEVKESSWAGNWGAARGEDCQSLPSKQKHAHHVYVIPLIIIIISWRQIYLRLIKQSKILVLRVQFYSLPFTITVISRKSISPLASTLPSHL